MSATDLPPYTGDNPTCTKCGNVGAHTKHRARGTTATTSSEHLERSCSRCDYEWAEATIQDKLAAAPVEPAEAPA